VFYVEARNRALALLFIYSKDIQAALALLLVPANETVSIFVISPVKLSLGVAASSA
jgi:hypothetical protein